MLEIPEPLNTALRVLSEVILHGKTPSAADVALLQAAAPDFAHERIEDLVSEIVNRELAKRKAARDRVLRGKEQRA